jgi:cell division protein FtsZ
VKTKPLENSIAVTIIATGFNVEQQNEIVNTEPKKIIHSLDGEHKLERDLTNKATAYPTHFEDASPVEMSIEEILKHRANERRSKLKDFNYKFHNTRVDDLEKEPAYKRYGIDLTENTQNNQSRMSLGLDSNDDIQLRSNNSFLHDNVD